jgi:hypothetical protein
MSEKPPAKIEVKIELRDLRHLGLYD